MTNFHILNVFDAAGHASLLMLAIPNASLLLILLMDPNMCTMSIAHQLLQHLLYTMPNSIVPPRVRCPMGNTLPQDKQGFRCCAICGWKVHLKELSKLTIPANACQCHHAMKEGVGRPMQRTTDLRKLLNCTRPIWDDDEEYTEYPDPWLSNSNEGPGLTPPQPAQPNSNEYSGLTPPKPAHVAPIDAPSTPNLAPTAPRLLDEAFCAEKTLDCVQALLHEKVGKGVKVWELRKLPRSESLFRLRGLGLNEYEVQRAQWALDQPRRWPVAKLFKEAGGAEHVMGPQSIRDPPAFSPFSPDKSPSPPPSRMPSKNQTHEVLYNIDPNRGPLVPSSRSKATCSQQAIATTLQSRPLDSTPPCVNAIARKLGNARGKGKGNGKGKGHSSARHVGESRKGKGNRKEHSLAGQVGEIGKGKGKENGNGNGNGKGKGKGKGSDFGQGKGNECHRIAASKPRNANSKPVPDAISVCSSRSSSSSSRGRCYLSGSDGEASHITMASYYLSEASTPGGTVPPPRHVSRERIPRHTPLSNPVGKRTRRS